MLVRKLWRDLLKSKTQFISIFLMSFLGIFIFVGIDAEVTGMKKGENCYYEETNLADAWIAGKAFTTEDVLQIAELNDVKAVERRITVEGKADLEKEPIILFNYLTTNEISSLKLVEGVPYESGSKGVWLDFNFVKKQGLKVGDAITFKLNNQSFTTVIKGTVYHPEYVYYLPDTAAIMPQYGDYSFAFLSDEEYPDIEKIEYNEVIVDLKNVDNSDGLSESEKEDIRLTGEKISKLLDCKTLVTVDKDQNISYQTFYAEIEQHRVMALIFPSVFLLISILGIITTMTRMTSNQRIQIGTLKALGFSKQKITLHYISYGFALSMCGSLIGAIIGYFTLPDLILGMFPGTYLMPYLHKALAWRVIVAILLEVLVSTLISFLACRKELKYPPAETLKPSIPKKTKHSAIEKSKIWLQLDFSTQWNIRDILRNKIRTIMGIIGVMGCCMLLLCAFGCLDCISYITGWMYGELNTAKSQIIMEEGTDYQTSYDYAKKFHGQMIETKAIEMESEGTAKTGSITVIDRGNYMHFQNQNLDKISLTRSGIAISYKMAKSLSIRKNDYIVFHILGDDNYKKMRVQQIYRNPSVQGITMTREVYEQLEYSFQPNTILTNMSVPKKLSDDESVAGVQEMDEMMKALDSMRGMMYLMVGILITAAIVLGVIVLYNLGVLSFVEKTREIATLKVLGFTSGKIRQILQKQNIWITAMGISAGIPTGYLLLKSIYGNMPDSMDFTVTIYLPSYLYAIAGTFIVSISVNQILSRKVKTIDMVDALKGVE